MSSMQVWHEWHRRNNNCKATFKRKQWRILQKGAGWKKHLSSKRQNCMAARPEVAAPVGPVPEGGVGRLVDPAVTHHPSPSILDGPVRQPLQPTHNCNSKKPEGTGYAEYTVPQPGHFGANQQCHLHAELSCSITIFNDTSMATKTCD